MRIAYYDIECHDLKAPYGPILCVSVLSLPENEMITFRQDEYVKRKKAKNMIDDRALLVDVRDFLEEHHITCGYYSKGFDQSHLRSRLLIHGERPLKKKMHFDPIWGYKGWRGVSFGSARMATVTKYVPGCESKPEVSSDTWMAARVGDTTAMDEVVERCESDVRNTRTIAEHCIENELLANITMY